MKNLIIAIAMITSLTATAQTDDEFEHTVGFYSSEGLGYTVADLKNRINLVLNISTKGFVLPVLVAFDSSCKKYAKAPEDAKSTKINDKLVKMVSQCYKANFLAFFPKTVKGREYLKDILKKENGLIVDVFEFKTEGYNYYSNKLISDNSGI